MKGNFKLGLPLGYAQVIILDSVCHAGNWIVLLDLTHWVRSFGMIWIRISDPRSLGSWCIIGTNESMNRVDLSVPLMHLDPSDLGSLIQIWITPKECTHCVYF